MRLLHEVSVKRKIVKIHKKCYQLNLDLFKRPLETAEENLRRLTGNQTVTLPYPECCAVQKTKYLQVQCPNCPSQYCSSECLT